MSTRYVGTSRAGEREATHEDLYPANSRSSILTSPLGSIVNTRALGTLTLRYDSASVIRFPKPA